MHAERIRCIDALVPALEAGLNLASGFATHVPHGLFEEHGKQEAIAGKHRLIRIRQCSSKDVVQIKGASRHRVSAAQRRIGTDNVLILTVKRESVQRIAPYLALNGKGVESFSRPASELFGKRLNPWLPGRRPNLRRAMHFAFTGSKHPNVED